MTKLVNLTRLGCTTPTCAPIHVPKLFMQVLESRRLLECTGYTEPSLLAYSSTNILWIA